MTTKFSELPQKVSPTLADEVAGLDNNASPVTVKMTLDAILSALATKNTKLKSADLVTSGLQSYLEGRISYDPDCKTNVSDTGITGVRVQIGQELMYLVYNASGEDIANGRAVFASGVDATNNLLTVDLADDSSFITSAQTLGLATHLIANGTIGLVTYFGQVRDFDTTSIGSGLVYLKTAGDMVNIKPLYPASRMGMGSVIKSHASEGIFQIVVNNIPRVPLTRSYSFTSRGVGAGTFYVAGFYDWSTTDIELDEGSLTVNYGAAGLTKAAHPGIVPAGPGSIVGGGQVGLRINGVLDSETGPQQTGQTAIITEDITTLEVDKYYETVEKFSGEIEFELYIVSGTPSAYSLTFNRGYSKYEDIANRDFTITAFEAKWRGAANSTLDVGLFHHKSTGWTYAASGFLPGNGYVCRKSVDQAEAGNVGNDEDGAYKRVSLDTFVDGNGPEGIIIEIITGSPNTLQSINLTLDALSEELNF